QGLHRDGPRGHRPRIPGPNRVKDCGLEMISTEDRSRVEETHLRPMRGSPFRRSSHDVFRIRHEAPRAGDVKRHGKSPSAAWPSMSLTSTGAPTCSLIFIARVESIVGIRVRSIWLAF